MISLRTTFLGLLLTFVMLTQRAQAQCDIQITTGSTNATCFGSPNGQIELTASNGAEPYTYVWSNGATTQDVTGLLAGTYTVTVTDQLTCTATASVLINQPTDILILPTIIDVTCFGGSTGTIMLQLSGGVAPYTYNWSDGNTTQILTDLVAGTYSCTVTDANGCTKISGATISQPTQLLTTLSPTDADCQFGNTGAVDLTASGGAPPYTYVWSNGFTTQDITNIPAGAYTCTITDSNNCTSTATTFVISINAPIAIANQGVVLNCFTPVALIDASLSSQGPEFTYNWTTPNGNIVSGHNTLIPAVDAPGVYTLLITNTNNGCSTLLETIITQDATPPQVNAGPDLNIPCNGAPITLVGSGSAGPNFTYLWTGPSFVSGSNTLNPVINQAGTYTLLVTNTANGCTSTSTMQVISNGNGLCSEIHGRVLSDSILNCQADAGELGLEGWIVSAIGTNTQFFAVTDANGDYEIAVEQGDTYNISVVPLSNLWIPCPSIAPIVANTPGQIYQADDILFQKLVGCPLLTVDLSSGNLRRCFSNNSYSIKYCNIGTEPAENAYINLTLDPFLSVWNSSAPFITLGNGDVQFQVGDLAPGECGTISLNLHLSCNAAVGQTHCAEVHIYPDTLCTPIDIQWSGASLRIESTCEADSVRFNIRNVGLGDMPAALDYIVIEDQVMLMSAPVQLNAGQSTNVTVPANGSTWRLEVEQEPFHPGFSLPALSVEGCTTSPVFSTGYVLQFPVNDADEFVDIHCIENTGSYDPNDKQGFPTGYGAKHYVKPGTPLEYLIRFQNTGNDTAFTVLVVDTLSAWLDPATVRVGASSHPYSWDLTGEGSLTFLFENILLPDSNVNEPASHGYVKFTIHPKADAPLETLVENTAHIYFDFNEAIVTNTTEHRLGENFVTVGMWQPIQPQYAIQVSPNPFSQEAVLTVNGVLDTAPMYLQVFDLQGKMQFEMTSEGAVFHLKRKHLSSGLYWFKVMQSDKPIGTGKWIIQD